ncbi:M15 family metallopeptidase [Cellulomonas denverensis]|uniref:M15 family metallopeptidase n=1 Tax=Cellulomonas denverensis TaxID=264297 RepID=UPI0035F0D597
MIAASVAVALVATAAVAGALVLRPDPDPVPVALDLTDLSADEPEFLAVRERITAQETSRQVRERSAAERAAAEQAAAQAAQAAADQAAADQAAAAAAEKEAADRAAAQAAAEPAGEAPPPGAPSHPRIAGWVDGRPVDSAGNVLWVTSVPTAGGDGSNGHMPMSAMCAIGWGTDQLGFTQYLRCDAADALTRLNDAYRAVFGASLDLDLTYRSYQDQVAMKAALGGLAATPGTSSHGLGLALDVQEWPQTYGFGTERYTWLVQNGPSYGWYAPQRVREGQPYAEYWHFEYEPGRTS